MSWSWKASVPDRALGARLLCLGDRGVEDGGAVREGAAERVLFGVRDRGDAVEVRGELRVRRAHGVAARGEQLRHHVVLDAEQAHRAQGATEEAAQHVAATLVTRDDAVADEHEADERTWSATTRIHTSSVRLAP